MNKFSKNITKEEDTALKTLIRLQREKQIVIKPVDKGGGLTIMDHDDYVGACVKELNSKTVTDEPYYRECTVKDLEHIKRGIEKLSISLR